uniref:DUF659 domain-containing protein n=1 Tax=Lactuca sativa TaxID=4236 RepID=A0A9R1XJ44_LACSA|nr:hypothetical protein LSAT_V11C400227280 [Lactuca sativa]
MVFGKSFNRTEDSETQRPPEAFFDLENEDLENEDQRASDIGTSGNKKTNDKDASRPLLEEVIFTGSGTCKNAGGGQRYGFANIAKSSTQALILEFTHISLRLNLGRPQKSEDDREKLQRLLSKVKEAESGGVSKSLKNSILSKKATPRKGIEESFGLMERNVVNMKIIRGLCANGISFNVLRNPQFIEMLNALKKAPEGCKPPSSENARTIGDFSVTMIEILVRKVISRSKLVSRSPPQTLNFPTRTVLLDECMRDVEKDLTQVKDTWYTQGVSIVSDGWSNVKHKPLINVLAVNAQGAMFIYADDFSGVGSSNVLQVVTDNAANCKAVGREVEKVYKHVFWSPCCVHTLNLIFKDLSNEFFWLNNTYKRGKIIVKYFLNHTQVLSIFREKFTLELLRVAKTRFASHYILLKRIKDCREALATTIVLNSWREWLKNGDESTKVLGLKVADTIKDDLFWEDVDNVLAITKPIFLLIKFCDGEGPKMGEIYEKMDNMLGEIKDIMQENTYSSYYVTSPKSRPQKTGLYP